MWRPLQIGAVFEPTLESWGGNWPEFAICCFSNDCVHSLPIWYEMPHPWSTKGIVLLAYAANLYFQVIDIAFRYERVLF